MYKKILVATDGSELAGKAVGHGIGLAKAVGAELVFVTVTEMWKPLEMAGEFANERRDAVKVYEEAAARSAEAILREAQARAVAQGMQAATRHVRDRRPAEGIVETADREDSDLIVMASHGRRGLSKMLLGSATAEVLVSTTRAILVLR